MSVYSFAAEYQAGADKEQHAVNGGVTDSTAPNQPIDRAEIMHDQVADIEQLQMGDCKVDAGKHRLHRLIELKRDFVQMPAQQENSGRDYKCDCVVR